MNIEILLEELGRENGFRLIAKIKGFCVGTYWVPLKDKEKIEMAILESYKKEKGIPRALIKRATKEIQNLANKNQRNITHTIHLVNSDSKIKLPRLFEEHQYESKTNAEDIILTRIYSPS